MMRGSVAIMVGLQSWKVCRYISKLCGKILDYKEQLKSRVDGSRLSTCMNASSSVLLVPLQRLPNFDTVDPHGSLRS